MSEVIDLDAVPIKGRKPHLWVKGQSGNPRGRPPKPKSVTQQIQKVLQEKTKIKVGGQTYEGTVAEILARRMIEKGLRTVDPKICKEIIDRADGKAVSQLEIMGISGKPIEIIVRYDGDDNSTAGDGTSTETA